MRRRVKKPGLGAQLAREAREYLADLRDLFASLRTAEGIVALVLILIIVGLAAAWFLLGLGFDRLLTVASSLGVSRPNMCREVDDLQGVTMVIGGMAFFLLAALAIGEMMRLVERARHNEPLRPRSVLIPAFAMLIVGIFGLMAMRVWC